VTKRHGLAGFKEILRMVGRDCGSVRPPLRGVSSGERDALAAEVNSMPFLTAEQRGW
jgi:dihydrodipicolinate synthase/N-acetylneuraminate lyase